MNSKMRSCVMGLILGQFSSPLPEVQKEPVAYLYNGVRLQDINECWTEKETHPYATILRNGKNTQFWLYVTPTACTGTSNTLEYPGATVVYTGNSSGQWYHRTEKSTGGTYYSKVLWTNYDLYTTDGTLVLAASDPIPVYE